jgi:adenosine deaminase
MIDRVRDLKIPLTECPLSNDVLKVYDRFFNGRRDIVRTSIDDGLVVTLNSDDPAFFGGYQNANFIKATGDSNLTKSELVLIARNGINATFAPDSQKVEMLAELNEYVASVIDSDKVKEFSKVESLMLQSWTLSI